MLTVTHVSLANRLNDISFNMHAGECWHVLGQNGAGKSSLFDVIAGLEQVDSGQIELNKTDIKQISIAELASKRTYLQQQYSLTFSLTVSEVLLFYTGTNDVPDLIEQALSVQLLLPRNINNLSGGEQQRVHIARCLMQIWESIEQSQAFVLLDEPIQSLDVSYQERALSLFKQLAAMGNLVVLSIHDVNLPIRYCDHVLMMKNHTALFLGGTAEVLNTANISELYDHPFKEVLVQNNSDKIFIRSPL